MKHMLSFILFSALVVFAEEPTLESPIAVKNVSFRQGASTQKVYISYDLENQPGYVTIDVLTNGVSIGRENIRSLEGDCSTDFSSPVQPGANKQIVWSARQDWPGQLAENAAIAVYACYTNRVGAMPGVYMVVDISGGSSAESYPVRYTFTPPDLASSVCRTSELWLKRCEAGSFLMGSASSELGRSTASNSDGLQETQHHVTLTKGFFAGLFPITVAQWKNIMGTNPELNNYTDLIGEDKEQVPMPHVSFEDIRGAGDSITASSFLGVLAARTGMQEFDLPTEAQWEYACRAGCVNAFNNGYDLKKSSPREYLEEVAEVAWYTYSAPSGTSARLQVVGQKKPNAWGFYDFHGNIYEVVRESPYEYTTTAQIDPLGAIDGTMAIYRSGCAMGHAEQCRSAFRRKSTARNSRGRSFGFRLFCNID